MLDDVLDEAFMEEVFGGLAVVEEVWGLIGWDEDVRTDAHVDLITVGDLLFDVVLVDLLLVKRVGRDLDDEDFLLDNELNNDIVINVLGRFF